MAIDRHFQDWVKAEQEYAEAKRELDGHTARLKIAMSKAEARAEDAKQAIANEMRETGEFEVMIAGTVSDYVIGWSTPRESVKADASACPDEFVKVERKPLLKELGEHLKKLREAGEPMPNYASLVKGEPVLQWRAVKKGA